MNTHIMDKVMKKHLFQPAKVTLEEAEIYCGITGLRELRVKYPYALKAVFQDWDDTGNSFKWAVYQGDLEHLKGEVQKVIPGPVLEVVKSIPEKVYSYVELGEAVGKSAKSITMLRYYFPDIFIRAPKPLGFKGVGAFFKAETIGNIRIHYSKVSPNKEQLEKARAAKAARKISSESSRQYNKKPLSLPPQPSPSAFPLSLGFCCTPYPKWLCRCWGLVNQE